jgi:sugar lactone lactonase YvrE
MKMALMLIGAVSCGVSCTAYAEMLYAVQNGDTLVTIDTQTRQANIVGEVGFNLVGGLTADTDGTLWAITGFSELLTIDPVTGAGTLKAITPAFLATTNGLAIDPTTGRMFTSTATELLLEISKDDGSFDVVGQMDVGALSGLSFDSAGQLWGLDGNNDRLVMINDATAGTTIVGDFLEYSDLAGLAVTSGGDLWSVHGFTDHELMLFDDNGDVQSLGSVEGLMPFGVLTGITTIPAPSGIFVVLAFAIAGRRRRTGSSHA